MGWLARAALTCLHLTFLPPPLAQVHGRCAELWRWMLGRPEEEIVLVSHESLLFHMLNFGCALCGRCCAGGMGALSDGRGVFVATLASSTVAL